MLEIIEPKSPEHLEAVRSLCRDFRLFMIEQGGQFAEAVEIAYPEDKYEHLMQELEVRHASPEGILRLALLDGEPVGCGMIQKFSDDTAEIKRVFLQEKARSTGAGRAIMDKLISDCRDRGYSRIGMDTGNVLTGALRLYDKMGFKRREPYHDLLMSTGDLMVYYEMSLQP